MKASAAGKTIRTVRGPIYLCLCSDDKTAWSPRLMIECNCPMISFSSTKISLRQRRQGMSEHQFRGFASFGFQSRATMAMLGLADANSAGKSCSAFHEVVTFYEK